MMRHGCHSWIPKPCRNVLNESIVSRLSTYVHTPDLERMDLNQSVMHERNQSAAMSDKTLVAAPPAYLFYILTVREPLARLLSAFVFEHPANQLAVPVMRQRFAQVFSCFPTLQSFANALGEDENDGIYGEHELGKELAVNATVTSKQCRLQARAMMNHKVRDSMHFYYDYRLVSKLLLNYNFQTNKFKSDTPLLVIRTEHLWSDWVRVNEWLSGDAPPPFTQQSVLKIHDTSQKQLVVTKTLDSHGRQRLCRALADEYHMYFLLIQRAVNLSPSEKSETMEQAEIACPELHWERLRGSIS